MSVWGYIYACLHMCTYVCICIHDRHAWAYIMCIYVHKYTYFIHTYVYMYIHIAYIHAYI